MTDKRLPVVVVHGVGSGENKDRAGFSKLLSDGVHEVARPVSRVGPFEPSDSVEAEAPNNGIYWQEALWESENTLEEAALKALVRSFLPAAPLAWLSGELLDVMADVPLYLTTNGERMRMEARKVIARHPNCVIVGHSLGSVVATDVLREAQIADNFASLPVSGLVTIGSPLNLVKMRSPMDGHFPFRWYNLYYPTDPIVVGGGLKKSVFPKVITRKLSAGETFAVSHTSYWGSTLLADIVYRLSMKGG